MKTKFILTLLFFLVLFNESIFADALNCSDATIYCNYQGLFQDINNADEEFKMLLEPPRHSNFQDMFSALLYVIGCSGTDKCKQALKNPSCNISKYAQKMVSFYEANTTKIVNEKVIKLFEAFKNGEGEGFFQKRNYF